VQAIFEKILPENLSPVWMINMFEINDITFFFIFPKISPEILFLPLEKNK